MFCDHITAGWVDALRAEVPGLDIVDVHTHVGQNDPDGFTFTTAQLGETLGNVGARGIVFPMHEPGGYPAANDAVIADAAASDGRLAAFLRLDPRAGDPLAEAERALAAGAVGIKLHPRAEQFPLDAPELVGVFELAGERRLPVLVHAGRGIPALGRHAVALCERHPGLRLILAHAGISDLAWIWEPARELPNLLFDTSWWSASDLLALWTLVPPGQILFASDAPYGTPGFAATLNLRCALQAGLSAEQIRTSFAAQADRLVAHEDLIDSGPAVGAAGLDHDPLLDRAHTFLAAAVGQMFVGQEPTEILSLARLALDVPDDHQHAAICAAARELLDLRERLNAEGVSDGRPARFAPGSQLVIGAAGLLKTPAVALPAATS